MYDYFSVAPDFVQRHAKESPEQFAVTIDGFFLPIRERQKKADPELAKKLGKYIFQVQQLLIADHKKLNPESYAIKNS